jgi:uncharacterized delta-60 repeat protein
MALKLVWLTLALALLPAVALAAPGDLDGSFSGDGVVALDWGGVDDFATGVLVQPDGRIVVPGSGGAGEDFIAARVGPDGSPDASFSENGFADFSLGAGLDEADHVALQADGKIVAAGFTADAADVSKGAVVRLNPDGSLDGSFNGAGLATIDAGGTTNAVTEVLIQPDGKIVAAGYGGPGFDGVVTRLNPDGLPDSTFDGEGMATFDFGGTNYVDAIARQSDGKLVVLGWTTGGGGMWLVRLNVDGSPDTSFDGDGRKPLPLATGDLGFDLLVQPDGKLVLIGGGDGFGYLVTRLTPDGSFDEAFADRQGIAAINFGASDTDFPSGGAVLQANGKIVIAGYTKTGPSESVAVARLQPGGSLDTSFSSDGLQTLPGTSSRVYGVGLQADGRIVVAGESGADALVVRLFGDGFQGGGGPAGAGPGGGGGAAQVPRCAGKKATIVGSPRSDRLKGTRRADVIVALGGNDRIAAGRGNDLICAGNGNDNIDGGLGNDRLYGQNGNDKLGGASGKDSLSGGGGKDQLSGGGGRDSCTGGSGKDRGACERGKL